MGSGMGSGIGAGIGSGTLSLLEEELLGFGAGTEEEDLELLGFGAWELEVEEDEVEDEDDDEDDEEDEDEDDEEEDEDELLSPPMTGFSLFPHVAVAIKSSVDKTFAPASKISPSISQPANFAPFGPVKEQESNENVNSPLSLVEV